MEHRDELLTIAEIAIGLAGFSGVVAAFLQPSGLHPADRVRFVNIFATSFSTLVLAFVPIIVVQVSDPGIDPWARSSAIMIAAWVINSAIVIRVVPHLRNLAAAGWVRGMVPIPSLLSLLAQILNVGGWVWEPGFLAYLFGLFVYIYLAGLMFVYVVLYRPRS